VLGERLDVDFGAVRREVDVGGFWMERFELTTSEWRRFIQSPEVAREIETTHAETGRWIRVPRETNDVPVPEFTQDLNESYPAKRIDCLDAEAYVAWRNAELRAAEVPFAAALPSEAEWEWAAGGESDRLFPWGDAFEPHLTESLITHPRQVAEPVGTHVRDESPFGVRDMGGSGQEFLRDALESDPAHFIGKGGCSSMMRGVDFAIDGRTTAPRSLLQGWYAIRLVYHER
jgi:formylglycine-generating enzyme required for sulfatase activity